MSIRAFPQDLVVLTDERLNYLADRYQALYIGALLGLTFEQYLARPDLYDTIAEALGAGYGIRIDERDGTAVLNVIAI